MQLIAALIPPGSVRENLAAVVRSVPGDPGELRPVPPALLHTPLASFGNVALGDRQKLAVALRDAVGQCQPLRLSFHGSNALEESGDDSVWATLNGDIEPLTDLAAQIRTAVRRIGFLLDRRNFRGRARVGRITDTTTAPYLHRLVDRLDEYDGPAWVVDEVALVRAQPRGADGHQPPFEVLELVSMSRPLHVPAADTHEASVATRPREWGTR